MPSAPCPPGTCFSNSNWSCFWLCPTSAAAFTQLSWGKTSGKDWEPHLQKGPGGPRFGCKPPVGTNKNVCNNENWKHP